MSEFYYKVPTTMTGGEDDPVVRFLKKYNQEGAEVRISYGDGVAVVQITAEKEPVIEDAKTCEKITDIKTYSDVKLPGFSATNFTADAVRKDK